SRRSLTSPAPCRTRSCCEIACLVTSKCAAIVPAVISWSRTSRRISRRRGSTIASIVACTPVGRVSYLQVDTFASRCLHYPPSIEPHEQGQGHEDPRARKQGCRCGELSSDDQRCRVCRRWRIGPDRGRSPSAGGNQMHMGGHAR